MTAARLESVQEMKMKEGNLDDKGRVKTGLLDKVGSTTYASNLQYAAHGGLTSMSLGSGMTESYTWNDRLPQTGVSAGSLLTLNSFPCAGGAVFWYNNNGNIQQQTITLPGTTATQQYGYDSLNRLTAATETRTPNCTDPGG